MVGHRIPLVVLLNSILALARHLRQFRIALAIGNVLKIFGVLFCVGPKESPVGSDFPVEFTVESEDRSTRPHSAQQAWIRSTHGMTMDIRATVAINLIQKALVVDTPKKSNPRITIGDGMHFVDIPL